MIAAVVPVKQLDAGKSRLADALTAAQREALTLAMLGDLLDALADVPQLDRRIVATPDPAVGAAAHRFGAEALVRDVRGLNPSLDDARAALDAEGMRGWLVVLGDVPTANAAELGTLFETLDALGGRGAVLAAARDGGTAALLRAPADGIPNRFGPDSAAAHEAAARAAELPFRRLELPSLAIDLDDRDDVHALRAVVGGATRTRALLDEALPERAGARAEEPA